MIKVNRAVVTGGAQGIGLESAKRLARRGVAEVIVVDRDFGGSDSTESQISQVEFDLADTDRLHDLVETIGPIDCLVNNAARHYSSGNAGESAEQRLELIAVNLVAPAELIRLWSKSLIDQSGRVINVGSVSARILQPDVWYGATKAGLASVTRSYAWILGSEGVQVNCVVPGPVEGKMLSRVSEIKRDAIRDRSIGRRFAKPSDIAAVIVWLALDAPNHLNGVSIDINDGVFAV